MEQISVFPYNNKPYADKQKGKYAYTCVNDMMMLPDILDPKIRENIANNRTYAEAMQDDTKYMAMLQNKFGKNSDFVNLKDLNMSGLGIARLLYRALYQRLNKVQNDFKVSGIDEKSMDEKKDFLYELKARAKLSPVIKEAVGFQIKKPLMPEDEEEIELYSSIGYKSALEILFEEHIKKVDETNQYDYEINPQVNSDFINGAIAATHLYFDDDGSIIEESIDMLDMKVIGGSKRDYSDAKGFIIKKQFNTEELFEYFFQDPEDYFFGRKGPLDNPDPEKLLLNLKTAESDKGLTEVRLCYWQAWDTHTKKEVTQDGLIKMRTHNSKNGDTKTRVQRWYRAYYIEQLGLVFKFGALPNMTRKRVLDKYTTAYCPVTCIRGVQGKLNYTSSPLSVIRKFEDLATLSFIKLQNEIATAVPAGYEYDLSQIATALELLKTDPTNAKMVINDLIDIHRKTGTIFKASKNSFQNSEYGIAARYVEGGLSKAVGEYLNILNVAIDFCYVFSGIPKIDTGAEQNPRTSNYVTRGMMDGADKAIGDLIESKDYLQLVAAEKKMNMVIRLYKSKDKLPNPYRNIFTKLKGQIMDKMDDISSRELALQLHKRMTDEEYAKMKEDLIMLSNRYRETNGNEGISPLEMMFFDEWFEENPKYAKYMLEMKIKVRQRDREESAQAAQQTNIQDQQQSAQMSQEGMMQQLQMKEDIEKLKKDLELRNKVKVLETEHDLSTIKDAVTAATNQPEVTA